MNIFKKVKTLTVISVLSLSLAGCFGDDTPQFKDLTTFNDFYNDVFRIKNELMMENPSLAGQMEISLLKLAAFDGFDVEQIDLRKGLVIPDILSVLPEDNISQLTAAYSVLGNRLYEGITIQEIISLSNQKEQEIYDKYNDKVLALLSDIDNKISSISAIVDSNKTIMSNINLINPELKIESQGSFNSAVLSGEILNGTSENIIAFQGDLKVLNPNDNSEIASSRIGILYDKKSLTSGETRNISENLLQAELTSLSPGIYPVRIEIFRFTNDTAKIMSNEEAISALSYLKVMRQDTLQYQNDLLNIINSSFEGAFL